MAMLNINKYLHSEGEENAPSPQDHVVTQKKKKNMVSPAFPVVLGIDLSSDHRCTRTHTHCPVLLWLSKKRPVEIFDCRSSGARSLFQNDVFIDFIFAPPGIFTKVDIWLHW